jgi:threonyl-tRNA synthetase
MNKSQESLDNLRHSAAHLLAAAVMKLWPNTKRTIGPAIENGFYFDFDFGEVKITESDLPRIEKAMKEILPTWKNFERHELSPEEAKKEYPKNQYKHELIDEFSSKGETLTFYKSGDYWDLCRGGHVERPDEELGHFKLLSIAGAYWRGDEKNKMLTRIYGTVFPTKAELDQYLNTIEEAKKRDHRKLGRDLDLFTFSDLVGSGLPLYTPKGALIRRLLTDFIETEQQKLGYNQVWTPQIAKGELFKISGHYEKYKDDMFTVHSHYSEEEFFLKPMNCPQHTQIYASKLRSYKDLPLRYSDFAMLYRDEKPGELNGLARVRSFSQDDCHIFCREDQVDEEIDKALTMTKIVMETFNFKYRYRLSTRDPEHPEKYLGDPKQWDKTEKWAVEIMQRNEIEYFDGVGEAAFYAPKMDLMATDALGREWQLSTVQIDYVQPERFGLVYIDSAGKHATPVMIHRAILGSAERVMMILIEHFAGKFPVWLSPVQVKILPITDKNTIYAHSIAQRLEEQGVRIELDDRNETLQAKIRDAQTVHVPFMIILGSKEEEKGTISIRNRDGKTLEITDLDKFGRYIQEKIDKKSLLL